jgi:hypothetical protein
MPHSGLKNRETNRPVCPSDCFWPGAVQIDVQSKGWEALELPAAAAAAAAASQSKRPRWLEWRRSWCHACCSWPRRPATGSSTATTTGGAPRRSSSSGKSSARPSARTPASAPASSVSPSMTASSRHVFLFSFHAMVRAACM